MGIIVRVLPRPPTAPLRICDINNRALHFQNRFLTDLSESTRHFFRLTVSSQRGCQTLCKYKHRDVLTHRALSFLSQRKPESYYGPQGTALGGSCHFFGFFSLLFLKGRLTSSSVQGLLTAL